jgi:type VI protein secretion system component Hcp
MKLGMGVKFLVPVLASILILGTLGLSQDAYGAWFVKFGDIEGESADQNHDKWIDVLSIDFADLRTITVSKDIDSSTPKLIEAACDGVESDPGSGIICSGFTTTDPRGPLVLPLGEVEIDICRTTHGKELQCYLHFVLMYARITSHSISGSTEGDQVLTENFSLNFDEIKVTFTEFDKKGAEKGNVELTWKVEEGGS